MNFIFTPTSKDRFSCKHSLLKASFLAMLYIEYSGGKYKNFFFTLYFFRHLSKSNPAGCSAFHTFYITVNNVRLRRDVKLNTLNHTPQKGSYS